LQSKKSGVSFFDGPSLCIVAITKYHIVDIPSTTQQARDQKKGENSYGI
jgi:hypothetical protein